MSSSCTSSPLRWHLIALTYALLISLSALAFLAHCAPLPEGTESDALPPLESLTLDDPQTVLANIMKSGLANECNTSQERKDTCEKCSRSLFDQRSGYEGCCRNYDGIHTFCEEFLGYSFVN